MTNENYSSDVQQAVTNALEEQKKKKRKKRLIILAVIAVVFIGLIAIMSSGSSDAPDLQNSDSKVQVTVNEEEFKAQCKDIPYKDLARDPDQYKNQFVHFKGEVIQVIESNYSENEYRVAVTEEEYGGYNYDDVVYLTYKLKDGESRILEDDIIEFYGTFTGLISYNSTLGGKITIPEVKGEFVTLSK